MNENYTENCATSDSDICAVCTYHCPDSPEFYSLRVWRCKTPSILTQKFIDGIDEFNSIDFSKVKLKNLVFKNKRFFNCNFQDTEYSIENFCCCYGKSNLWRVNSNFSELIGFRE